MFTLFSLIHGELEVCAEDHVLPALKITDVLYSHSNNNIVLNIDEGVYTRVHAVVCFGKGLG